MDAARCGQAAEAEEAIHLGADLAATDAHGMTALHYAAARGSMGIVNLLIKYGAPLDAVDSTGMAPLHSAVIHDRTVVVSKLLSSGCAVDIVDARGFTPLHHAASTGQLAMVRLLVEAGCASLQIKTRLQLTPLLCAVEKRRCNTIRYLADAQTPCFVLPAEPNDFLPSCPNPSVTLSRFLKTLPPRPSQAIQNDAEVRAALGPRNAVSAGEEAKVKEEVEKVKGERSVALVRRAADDGEAGGSGRATEGEPGEGTLGELLSTITDKDSEAKRSEMWTGRRGAARCVTGMVRRALVQREYGETVEREVRERARRRWAVSALSAAMARARFTAATRALLQGRIAGRGALGRVVVARAEQRRWRGLVSAGQLLASCVLRRGARERVEHLRYIARALSAERLAVAFARSVHQRALRRTLLLAPPAALVIAPRIRAALARRQWQRTQTGAGRLVAAARGAGARRAWAAESERRREGREGVGRVVVARAERVRMGRRRAGVRVLWEALVRAAGVQRVRAMHAAAQRLQGVLRGRGARVAFWRMQGEAGMGRCSVLERRKQAKLRQPSWKRDDFQREVSAAHDTEDEDGRADAVRRLRRGAGSEAMPAMAGVWWPCFAVDHVGEAGWTEADFDDGADYGREWEDSAEAASGCEHVLHLAFGAQVSLPRPLSSRPSRPASGAGVRPGSSSGRPGTSAGPAPDAADRPGTAGGSADIHLDDRPPSSAAGRPPLHPSSRPPTSAGRPGTSGGPSDSRPGTGSGRPGTSSGQPGKGGGRPGTSGGVRHFCGEESAEEVVGRWGAAHESISLVDDDDLAEAAVENMVAGAGRSISEGLKCWLALCIARRRLRTSVRDQGGRAGPEKGLARLKEHAQGGRERREEGGADTEGRLTTRQRICCLLHVGFFALHLGEPAVALKAFTAARTAAARREERQGEERWPCALAPHPVETPDRQGDEEEEEEERGVGMHVEAGLGLVGVVAQANCAACLLAMGAPEPALLHAEAALKLLTRAGPLQPPPPTDRPSSARSGGRAAAAAEEEVEAAHIGVVRSVMRIAAAAREANGQHGQHDVVVLGEEEKGRRRESMAKPDKRESGRDLRSAEAWSTQPLGRLGCFGPTTQGLTSAAAGSGGGGGGSALGSVRTSSEQVAEQISTLLEPASAAGASRASSSGSSSGSAGGGEEGEQKRSERKRFGPNGATWRMTHGTRPLSGSRQKAMGFDPDIGRHAPYLAPSTSGTILGGRNGQPVN